MKKNKTITIFVYSLAVIFALILVYDYKKPQCVEAQVCVPMFGPGLEGASIQQDGKGKNTTTDSEKPIAETHNREACFLTYVALRDAEGDTGEFGKCRVYSRNETVGPNKWVIQAEVKGDKTLARCGARCLLW